MRLRPLDFVIIAASAAAVVLASLSAYTGRGGELRVVVQGESGEWIYPIDEDREIEVPGPLGLTRVHIEGKAVRIEDSPCPTKTCVASGAIAEADRWLACLPNQVFVRIEGQGASEGIDATVY